MTVTEIKNIIISFFTAGVTGEKVVTVTSSAVNKSYTVLEVDATGRALSALVAADFSSGFGTVIGTAGEKAYGTAYNYDCVATNTWSRTPIGLNAVNIQLATVADGSGVKTASYMTTNYSTAIDYQIVLGVNGYYQLMGGVWRYNIQNLIATSPLPTQFVKADGSFDAGTYIAIVKGQYSTTATAMTVFTVTIGSTQANNTYNLAIAPTTVLAGASYYISAKTTTTFDITYLTAISGAVSFDWTLFK